AVRQTPRHRGAHAADRARGPFSLSAPLLRRYQSVPRKRREYRVSDTSGAARCGAGQEPDGAKIERWEKHMGMSGRPKTRYATDPIDDSPIAVRLIPALRGATFS